MPSPEIVYMHATECNDKNGIHHNCFSSDDIIVSPRQIKLNHPKECLQPQEKHSECPTIYSGEGSQGKNSYRVPIPMRFDLIPPIVLQQLAEVYEEGAKNYGDSKYLEKPLPYSTIVNHMMNHFMLYLSGDRSELHLAKVIWGAASMITLDKFNDGKNNDMFYGGKLPNVSEANRSTTESDSTNNDGDRT